MLVPKSVSLKDTPKPSQDPFDDIYFMQNHLIEETQALVGRCFDPENADLINYDALQAICFLVTSDMYIDLGKIELQNCLDLLGVHPVVLEDTMRILKKMYHIPKNADLLSFIRLIGPLLREQNEFRAQE